MREDPDESGIADDATAPSSPTMRQERLLASVDPDLVKAVVKPLLGMGALVFLLLIVSFLPGLDQVIPATPITLSALVVALFTMGIVSVLVYVAPQLEKLMQQKFGGSTALSSNAAAIMKHLDLLVAIFIAHWGLAGLMRPILTETTLDWTYDMVFLLLALIPTTYITLHLYRGLDPAAEYLTQKITVSTGPIVNWESDVPVQTGEQPMVSSSSQSARNNRSFSQSMTASPLLTKFEESEITNRMVRFLQRRSNPDGDVLTKKERVHQLLEEHDGRIQQTTIVDLTGWSKSTVSRVLSEMKDDGLIVKTNIGHGNLISLPGDEPDSVKAEQTDWENGPH